MICFQCKKDIPVAQFVGRRDECPHCGADSHVCLNCDLHDPRLENECREPKAETVREKDRSNFCDHFTPNKKQPGAAASPKLDPKAQAEALFKKKT